MASVAPRELKIGKIIDKTLAVVERCAGVALVYFVALTVINGAIGYAVLGMAPMQQAAVSLLKAVFAIILAYLALDAMIRKTGLRTRGPGDVFLRYFAMSILYTLGVVAGFILLVFPGLFVMARWALAQPLLVARGDGITQSLGESWEQTKDNEFQILAVVLLFLVPSIAISLFCQFMLGKDSVVGLVITQLASSASSALMLAMAVALYGLIIGTPKDLAATFE